MFFRAELTLLAVPLWRQWDTRGAEALWSECKVSLVQHEWPAIEDDRVTVVCHQILVCVYVHLVVCGIALRAVMSSAEPPWVPGALSPRLSAVTAWVSCSKGTFWLI